MPTMHTIILLFGMNVVMFTSLTYSLPILGHISFDKSAAHVKKRAFLPSIWDPLPSIWGSSFLTGGTLEADNNINYGGYRSPGPCPMTYNGGTLGLGCITPLPESQPSNEMQEPVPPAPVPAPVNSIPSIQNPNSTPYRNNPKVDLPETSGSQTPTSGTEPTEKQREPNNDHSSSSVPTLTPPGTGHGYWDRNQWNTGGINRHEWSVPVTNTPDPTQDGTNRGSGSPPAKIQPPP